MQFITPMDNNSMIIQRKIRIIKPAQNNSTKAFGITIPPEIADFYKDTYFTFIKSNTDILLFSGTLIDIKNIDIRNIKLEDFKVWK